MELSKTQIRAYNNYRETTNNRMVCHAPFSSLNFTQSGNANVCCYNRSHVLGTYPQNTIEEMWFGEKARALREAMDKNDLTKGCHLCAYQIASSNFEGVLAKNFDHYATHNELIQKTGRQLNMKYFTMPKVIEFELSNTCNLECVMCNGHFSSSIRQNREKKPPLPNPYDDSFVEQLEPFVPHLMEAKFLGGEPFLIPIYYRIWELIKRKKPDLNIYLTTNGTILTKKVKQILDELKFNLIISIDGFTKSTYESIRKNANYEKFMENFEYFYDYCKSNNRLMGLAICPMPQNWFEIPDLVHFCNQREIKTWYNTVIDPLEYSLKSQSVEKLDEVIQHYESVDLPEETPHQKVNKKAFVSLINQVKAFRAERTEQMETIA